MTDDKNAPKGRKVVVASFPPFPKPTAGPPSDLSAWRSDSTIEYTFETHFQAYCWHCKGLVRDMADIDKLHKDDCPRKGASGVAMATGISLDE